MQTRDGLPVGYELFGGNTTDVTTLGPAIASLKARFALDRVVLVVDSGVLSAIMWPYCTVWGMTMWLRPGCAR